jgi:hypothetical protein
VRKLEGKIPLEQTSGRWEDNIKIVIQKERWVSVDWIDRTEDWD